MNTPTVTGSRGANWKQPRCPPTREQTDKQNVVCAHTGETRSSQKRECGERTVTRVTLRNALPSRGSQSRKPRHRARGCLHKTRRVSNC